MASRYDWVAEALVNDEISTDGEMTKYFIENGLSPLAARQAVKQRDRALLNPLTFKLDTRGLGL